MDIYKKIKIELENSRKVLFSGTPCQIAGLLSFLNKEYPTLYTIDVFCHGVPSPEVFKRFLIEKEYDNSSIVNFRNKEYGWNNYNVSYENLNGKYSSSNESDTYINGFISNLYLRECCHACKYNLTQSRPADISIGDFWGVEQIHPEFNDDKGTSAIIINSEKGRHLFNDIKKSLFIKEVLIEDIEKNNPILKCPCKPHKKRKLFFSRFHKNTLKNIEKILKLNKNVAILNHVFTHDNYGALMVAYSMERIVYHLGYYPATINVTIPGKSMLDDFKHDFLNLTKTVKLDGDYTFLNKDFKTFIVGSDQVWRNWWKNDSVVKKFFLDFADSSKRLISYGASFGLELFEGSGELKSEISELLKAFSGISVREENGLRICKDTFNTQAELVLDPTLLIDVSEYDKIINFYSNKKIERSILACIIFPKNEFDTEETNTLINNISSHLNINIEYILNKEISVSEWLKAIKDAEYIVTDSFHGLMFSIIYKKQFICLVNKQGGASRFYSIAKLLGLENRIFENVKDINVKELLKKNIDYNDVYKKLIPLKRKSIIFLQNALAKHVKNNGRHQDILSKMLYCKRIDNNNKRWYILHKIPILKTKTSNNTKTYYLFHFIPLLKRKVK